MYVHQAYHMRGTDGAVQKFQDLEEERIDFMKNSLWTFANVASTVCVSDDAVRSADCQKLLQLLIIY